jgi:hypothetical protein
MIIYKYTRFNKVNDKYIEQCSRLYKYLHSAKRCAKEFIADSKDEDNLEYVEQKNIDSEELYCCDISWDSYYCGKIETRISITEEYLYD